MTIRLPPSTDPYPLFEVKDLTKNDSFSHLPFVQDEPHFRFYAGTPLTTKRGINIGSVCVMDTKPRDGLDQEQISFLGWLAGLVITHLEINREAMEGRRSKLMSDAFNVFIDGRSTTKTHGIPSQMNDTARSGTFSYHNNRRVVTNRILNGAIIPQLSPNVPSKSNLKHGTESLEDRLDSPKDRTTTSSDHSSDGESFEGAMQHEADSEGHRFTFGRAANILRECLELGVND